VKPDIGSESRFLHTPLALDAPLGSSRRNIDIPFGVGKLERLGYPMVEDMFIHFDRMYERDRRTHTHTHTHTHTQGNVGMTAKGPFIATQLNSTRRRLVDTFTA